MNQRLDAFLPMPDASASAGRRSTGTTPAPIAALAMLVVALGVAGCSNHPRVLATVGDRSITVDDFDAAAAGAGMRYPAPPDSAKSMLLEDLIRRELLLQGIKHSGTIVDTILKGYRRNVENEVLSQAMTERLAPRTIPVSEAELRELYEWRNQEAHIHLIYAVDARMAEAAKSDLDHGAPFGAVANRFNLVGLLPPQGDLGFLPPGALVNPLDEYLRHAPLGAVIGPVQAPGEGWFIAQVTERRPRKQDPFEIQRFGLAEMLEQRKRRSLSIRAFQSLRDEFHLTVSPDGPQYLFSHFNSPEAANDSTPLTPAELSHVLATYDRADGGKAEYTLRDALQDLESGQGERPNPSMLPSFDQWIQSRVMQRLVVEEAKKRRLHEEPAIARRIEDRINSYLLDSYYETGVIAHAAATPADLQHVYEQHASQLKTLQSAEIQHLTVPDSTTARLFVGRIPRGTSLKDAFILTSGGMQVREETVHFPSNDPVWGPLQPRIQSLSPGEFGEPVPVPKGWRIYQLVSKQETVPSFENLPAPIQNNLRVEAAEPARERRLNQLCDSLATVFRVERHREALKNVAWPPPLPAGM